MADTFTDPQDWRAAGQTASLNGRTIFFRDFGGDGAGRPPVFILHGFPTAGWDFHKVWGRLTARYRTVAPDLLGFGFSDKPDPHRYSIAEQADLMEALWDRLALDRCHLLAHDYGDTVGQELLARDNARPRGERRYVDVCLLNGGLFPETHRARPMQTLLASPIGPLINKLSSKSAFDRSFSRVFGAQTKPDADELDAFWRLINAKDGRHVFTSLIGYMAERRTHRARWVGALIEAHCPIQLINGSDDPVSGAHMVARYRELVRAGDDIVELAGIGHYPQMEAPETVANAYLRFAAEQDTADKTGAA